MRKKTVLERFKEIEELEVADEQGKTVKDILPYFCDNVEQALNRLESIDNSNPSEALECLEYICKILNEKRIDVKWLFKHDYNTIKQALLKAQEPKHYLKWEDLEFTKDTKCQKAKMNGKEYTLHYFILNDTHKEVLIQDNDGSICSACNEQFFNDLHLEGMEE